MSAALIVHVVGNFPVAEDNGESQSGTSDWLCRCRTVIQNRRWLSLGESRPQVALTPEAMFIFEGSHLFDFPLRLMEKMAGWES